MKTTLQHNVTLEQPIDKVWAVLSDPWQVAPCLPGAEVTEALSDTEYAGKVKIKLGPLGLTVKGRIVVEELDHASYKIRMRGKGQDALGAGSASMTMTGQLTSLGDSSTALATEAEIEINGRMAQFASRLIHSVSDSMFNKFLANLQKKLSEAG